MNRIERYTLFLFAFGNAILQTSHAMEVDKNPKNDDEYFVWMQFEVKDNEEQKYYTFFVSLQATPSFFFDKIVTFLKKTRAIRQEEEISKVSIYSEVTQKNGNINEMGIGIKPKNFKQKIMTLIELDKEINKATSAMAKNTKFVQYRADKISEDQNISCLFNYKYREIHVITSENELQPFYTLLSRKDLSDTFVCFSFAKKEDSIPIKIYASTESSLFNLMRVLSQKLDVKVEIEDLAAWQKNLEKKLNMKDENSLEGESCFVQYPNEIEEICFPMQNLNMFFEQVKSEDIKIQDILTQNKAPEYNSDSNYNREKIFNMIKGKSENTSIISKSVTLEKDQFIDAFNRKNLHNDTSGCTATQIGITSGVIVIILGIIGSLFYYMKQSKTADSIEDIEYDDQE